MEALKSLSEAMAVNYPGGSQDDVAALAAPAPLPALRQVRVPNTAQIQVPSGALGGTGAQTLAHDTNSHLAVRSTNRDGVSFQI